ncbi:TPA: hypothetical protein ACX6SA_000518 [Photobacterium damselae]
MGANVIAKGYAEFQKVDDDIELVFYHDGVVAMVNMKYKYELNDGYYSSSSPTINHPETVKSEKWVLFEKLPKDKSSYKVIF